MSNRLQRLEVLRVILASSNNLSSHEEILGELAKNGCQVTQATLSRDLAKLHATKFSRPTATATYCPKAPCTTAR